MNENTGQTIPSGPLSFSPESAGRPSGRLRILQLAPRFKVIGGVESYVAGLSERFHAKGHETLLIVSELKGSVQTPYPVVNVPGFFEADSENSLPSEQKVEQLAAEFRPDLVLSHDSLNARLLLALNSHYPTLAFLHSYLCRGLKLFRGRDTLCEHPIGPRCLLDWYLGPCGSGKSPGLAWKSYRRATTHAQTLRQLFGVLVASESMRQYLIGEGVSAQQIHAIDYTEVLPPEQPTRPVSAGPIQLLFVGRLVYNKGVQYALHALSRLESAYRLTIVGDGYYRAKLQALAETLGVQDRVEFTGTLFGSDLDARYKAATILIVPSIWPEPAGLVVPEARAHGLPVVTFRAGGLSEWVNLYDSIYYAERADRESLIEAIRRAAANAPLPPRQAGTDARQPLVEVLERLFAPAGQTRSSLP